MFFLYNNSEYIPVQIAFKHTLIPNIQKVSFNGKRVKYLREAIGENAEKKER